MRRSDPKRRLLLPLMGAVGVLAAAPARLRAAVPEAPDGGPADAEWLALERLAIRTVDAIDAAVDAKDWALARKLFAQQVEVDVTSLGGPKARMAADALVGGWARALAAPKTSLHLRTNHRVMLAEGRTRAVVDSHGYAWNAWQGRLWEVWGTYRHGLRRAETGAWQVDAFAFFKTQERGDPAVPAIVPPG